MNENRMGKAVFLRDLADFQDIEETGELPMVTRLFSPISRTKRFIIKSLENWAAFVGVVFLFFTLKILIERWFI